MAYRLKRRSQRAEEGADVLGELLRGFKSGEVAARGHAGPARDVAIGKLGQAACAPDLARVGLVFNPQTAPGRGVIFLSSLEAAGSSLAVEPIAVSRVDEFMIGDFY